VIGLVVLASVVAVFRKLVPQLSNRWLAAASIRLGRHGRTAWLRAPGPTAAAKAGDRRLQRRLQHLRSLRPKPPVSARVEAVPLEFRPRGK